MVPHTLTAVQQALRVVTIAFLHRACCCCCLLIPLAKVLADAFGQGSGSHLCPMPLITQPAALRASYLRSGRMQPFNPFSIGVQALVSTISRENRGHPFWEGRGVSVAEMEAWLWQFLRLDKRNSPTLQYGSGSVAAWPDGNASEEYQTQSYFCLSSREPRDGAQGLPESPAALLLAAAL